MHFGIGKSPWGVSCFPFKFNLLPNHFHLTHRCALTSPTLGRGFLQVGAVCPHTTQPLVILLSFAYRHKNKIKQSLGGKCDH